MAQQSHDPSGHPSPRPSGRQAVRSETRTRSAEVGAVAACVGRKRRSVASDTTQPPGRQPTASDGRIQLRPPVLLPMNGEQEDTAVALLAELTGAGLARGGLDLMSGPIDGLLDPRPAADAAQPPSPAA